MVGPIAPSGFCWILTKPESLQAAGAPFPQICFLGNMAVRPDQVPAPITSPGNEKEEQI